MPTRLLHLPSKTSAEEAAACVKENGYVIIDDLVAAGQMDDICNELSSFINGTAFGQTKITGELTRRTGSLVARSPTVRELIMHPLLLTIIGKCLSSANAFQLSLTEVISLYPGAEGQFIHRDGPSESISSHYESQISTLWAMTEYTEEMGATRIVPRSHILPHGHTFSIEDTVPAVMTRGSVLIYSGKLYHGGGANRSGQVRQAINLNYSSSWIRQEENQYLSCPTEIARDLAPDLLKLMGYDTYMSFGRMGDWKDPLMALLGRNQRLDESKVFGDLSAAS